MSLHDSPQRGPRLGISLRALGGRLGEQWERDRRDTLFLMGAIALAATPHFTHLPWWASVGFVMLFIWRLGLVLSGRWLPRDSVRWVAAIACTAAVYAHYKTLLGRDVGVTLLVLFLGLKLMEMRARRDLFVVLFLCFFLLLTAFFYSQSLWVAAISVTAVIGLVATMLTMQFGLQEASIARRFRMAGLLLIQALPIAAALFVLFPRVQGPLWGLPEDAASGRTGLGETMTPGAIASLSRSDEVAFRVLFEGSPPHESQQYWRGPVLGLFDGREWKSTNVPAIIARPPQIRAGAASQPLRYTVTQEPNFRNWLFALDAPFRVNGLPNGYTSVAHDMQLLAREIVADRLRYSVESRLDYTLDADETPASLQHWTDLPNGFNPRALALAAQLTNEERDPAALVTRVLRMFREEPFRYTLSPPLLGANSVDEFLFASRAGFCEHYASAFVVLMRAMSIPARVVTGYQGGERNPVDGYWLVRQADAHAWAEVWLEGRGWQRVDPTSAVAPERIERGSRALRDQQERDGLVGTGMLSTWRFNIDALSNSWNQWILSYDSARQRRLFSSVGLSFEDWQDVAGVLAAILALLIGAAALLTLHPRRPRDPVERLYEEFCDRLAEVGLIRAGHETAAQFVERAARVLDPDVSLAAREIATRYNRMRYAAPGHSGDDVRHLRTLVQSFKPR